MLIDKNGRLFGKINLLDVLFVLVLTGILVVAYFFFAGNSGDTAVPVTYTLEVQNREADYFKNVHIGESVVDGITKAPAGEIIGFTKEPARVLTQANDELIIATPENRYDGYIKIKTYAEVAYPDLLLGSEPLKVGKDMALRSESLAMHGYIVSIEYDKELVGGLK